MRPRGKRISERCLRYEKRISGAQSIPQILQVGDRCSRVCARERGRLLKSFQLGRIEQDTLNRRWAYLKVLERYVKNEVRGKCSLYKALDLVLAHD
jgi:hypothetical protein